MTSLWLTAAQLAGLPGLPASERRTRDWLTRMRVPQRPAQGKAGGGGTEWDTAALPKAVRDALLQRQLAAAAPPDVPAELPAPAPQPSPPAQRPAVPALPAAPGQPVVNNRLARAVPALPAAPTRQAQECADARTAIVAYLHDMQAAGLGLKAATTALATMLASGTAPDALLDRVPAANQRLRTQPGTQPISARTLLRWHADHAARGWAGLLPAATGRGTGVAQLPADVAAVLARYASTSGAARNLSHVVQAVCLELGRPLDDWQPLYHRCRRALPKLPKVDLIKARHTGAERDARLPYKRRLTHGMACNEVWVIDGHTFKAKVRHPDHGQPFAPEVTVVIDVADRYVVGWSVSLSENTIAVGDAVRHAVSHSRVPPAMIYSDGGSGETARVLDCDVAGLYARLGTSHPVGLPGKPQGHGLIERSWQTHMLRCARQYGSYQGRDADSHTVRNTRLELAREATALKRAANTGAVVALSRKVPGWQQFIADVAAEVQRYNTTHRHRSLPKHTEGPHAGKHMTPAECRQHLGGTRPDPDLALDDATIRHLFMPAMLRTPARGWVRLLNQWYYSDALMDHATDGVQCRVHYDIHDASRVWVWTVDGHFVCEAKHEGNSLADYMPRPAIELAKERRVRAAIKRREAQIETALAELQPTVAAEVARSLPAPQDDLQIGLQITPPRQAEPLPLVERVEPTATVMQAALADGRPPFFASAAERYEWLMQHPAAWADGDAGWLAGYADSPDYQALADYWASRGIAWAPQRDSPGFEQAG